MAKDPAFLFYPGDWLGGTMGMTFEEKGCYIDLLIFQFNRGSFTEKQALAFLKSEEIWQTLKCKFTEEDGLFFNNRLNEEKEKRSKYTESRRNSRLKSDEDNVRIYIVRDDVRSTYKIGSSVNPQRRYNELSNQINPAIIEGEAKDRKLTLLWYSDPVLRKVESTIHNHFKNQRLSGEWFELSESDLSFIFNKYKGKIIIDTNVRTLQRTENEIENEYVIEFDNKDVDVIKKQEKLFDEILNFFGYSGIDNLPQKKMIFGFVYSLPFHGKLDFAIEQIGAYIQLKTLDKFPHKLENFLGKQDEQFKSGKWNDNWTTQLKNYKSQNNAKANQRNSGSRATFITGSTDSYSDL